MIAELLWPILAWWLVITVLGWAALPAARRLFAVLPDQGLGFSRPLGLLAAGYLYWLGGLTGLLPNTMLGAWAVALAVAAGGAWLARRDREALLPWLRSRRRLVLGYELLFLLAFGLWAVYRAYNPNIETAGGEKYMEMAFINGVLSSARFPPNDPWMAGFSISYYYFGYVLAALLVRLTGVLPWVGFTLVVPATLAMVLSGAFSLGYNLVALVAGAGRWARVAAGGLTGLLLAGIGSLEGALELAFRRGWGSPAFWDWLDVKNLTVGAGSCNEPGEGYGAGGWLPTRFIWWWRGSRVLHDRCGEVIHEFPFFSLMLADAHPHLLNWPFTLLVLALALMVLAGGLEGEGERPLWSPRWLALPLVVGALGFTNAWDLPTFSLVVVLAYALRAMARPAWDGLPDNGDKLLAAVGALGLLALLWRGVPLALGLAMSRLTGTEAAPSPLPTAALALLLWVTLLYGLWSAWRRARAGDVAAGRLLDVGRFTLWLLLFALLFYLPFHLGFRSQVTGIAVVEIRSRLAQWLVHFGLLAFLGLTLVAVYLPALRRARPGGLAWGLGALALGVAVVSLLWQAWTALALVVVVGLAAVVGLALWRAGVVAGTDEGRRDEGGTDDGGTVRGGMDEGGTDRVGADGGGTDLRRPAAPAGEVIAPTFALVCLAVGALMPLGTEFLFVKDLFGSRMNSIFKLYFQAWTLLSVAGGFCFYAVWRQWRRPAVALWALPAAALLLASLVYPVAAVITRTNGFTPPTYGGVQGLTLDGLAWWRDQYPDDLAAAEWLRANAEGTPVILEAPGGGYSHNGRIAMATGFPTVMGWDGHEHQWRGERSDIDPQKADAIAMYTTTDPMELERLLDKYDVRYVILGDWERAQADLSLSASDEERFRRLLKPVFSSGNTLVFQRP